MAPNHRRSPAVAMPVPFPTSSRGQNPDDRWSGESLAPSDGYSGLFTSGMIRQSLSPSKQSRLTTPTRQRRRVSITPSNTSPYKAYTQETSAERALTDVMRALKLAMSPRTPHTNPRRIMEESRWSSSSGSPDSHTSTAESFWRSRKSGESVRPRKSAESSRPKKSLDSIRPRKSFESARSTKNRKKTRKSGEIDRMDLDIPEVPPVPVPITPRRSMVGDLARRLGLTPKKRQVPPPVPNHPLNLPLPPPRTIQDPNLPLPRKSSLITLRSLAKKGSTTTLRSIRTVAPPLPSTHPFALPTTPARTLQPVRPAKSSIGPPKAVPSVSPSKFLDYLPRPAPITPKRYGMSSVQQPTGMLQSSEAPSMPTPKEMTTPDLSMTTDADLSVASSYVVTPAFLPAPTLPTPRSMSPALAKTRRMIGLLPRRPNLSNLPSRTGTPSIVSKKSDGPLSYNTSFDSPMAQPIPPSLLERPRLSSLNLRGLPRYEYKGDQEMPYRSGKIDGWNTPHPLNTQDEFFANFVPESYSTPPLSIKVRQKDNIDFTASPSPGLYSPVTPGLPPSVRTRTSKVPGLLGVDVKRHERPTSAQSNKSNQSAKSKGSAATAETEEKWELEKYLESEVGHDSQDEAMAQ
ncbi:hypothetical protein M231_07164 [Tremella mesenterica]|uniref:Uncharacterized protein n=1 Tax=Tremella mesenterica TaxID=5217 RepID=A0A4Q1B9X5_TREME|nr:hypothetical protein M231_07164 [Tremella mesenterica]